MIWSNGMAVDDEIKHLKNMNEYLINHIVQLNIEIIDMMKIMVNKNGDQSTSGTDGDIRSSVC